MKVQAIGSRAAAPRQPEITLVAKVPLTAAERQKLLSLARRAYAFDMNLHQWSRPLAAPLTVVVGKMGGWGIQINAQRLRINPALARRKQTLAPNTFAHELTHIQVRRAAGNDAYSNKLPWVLQEGWACVVGDRFSKALNVGGFIPVERKGNAHITGAAALRLLNGGYRTAELWNGEETGAMLVEFLRTRLRKPDIFRRLAKITEATGNKERFVDAFHQQLGISWSDAKERFVAYMTRTEGDPGARFRGTIWDT